MAKMTQADRDAGLSQEDVDAGLRAGKSAGITDEDRARAKMNTARDGESIVDRYRDYDKNPEAKAFPVANRAKLEEKTEIVPLETPRRTSNDDIGDLVRRLGSGRVGTTPSSFSEPEEIIGAKRGGAVNKMKKKSSVSSASKRGDGIATKGKTKGRFV